MYTTRVTSALTGATPAQLRHWRRDTGSGTLLSPVRGPGGQVLYSYEDLVALRMFVALRQQKSLQSIRRAVAEVLKRRPETHPSGHRLQAAGASIIWITEDGQYVDVVESPGQGAIKVVMDQIFGEFRTEDGRWVPDLHTPAKGLSISPDVRSGYPVLDGTRLPYDQVASLAADGLTDTEIINIYPSATPQGIAGAREFSELVEQGTRAA
jgi:uncharacterized protein (DUF433 family)/DNA-binding transcriptional MerR regulator